MLLSTSDTKAKFINAPLKIMYLIRKETINFAVISTKHFVSIYSKPASGSECTAEPTTVRTTELTYFVFQQHFSSSV